VIDAISASRPKRACDAAAASVGMAPILSPREELGDDSAEDVRFLEVRHVRAVRELHQPGLGEADLQRA
jgi:hypothetical protein